MRRDIGPVLITGCSSGLGRAAATAFGNAGFLTIASARNVGDLSDLAACGCKTMQLDVTDEESRRAAIVAVEREHGPVGVLVNNAGYGQYGPLEQISGEALRREFETNVFGMFHLIQLVLPAMRRAGRGRIINVSSVAGRVAVPGGGAYHMTKFALEAMADALRLELKPFGIDLVNVLPGPFASRFRDKAIASIPMGGADTPYAIYERSIAGYLQRFLDPRAIWMMSAEHVAAIVLKAATVARPRTRYNVGLLARFGPPMRGLLPDRLIDAYMRWQIPDR